MNMNTQNTVNRIIARNQLHLELHPEFSMTDALTDIKPRTLNFLKRHALTLTLLLIVAIVGATLWNAFGTSTGNSGSVISAIPAVLLG
jgi:hypothetical protein